MKRSIWFVLAALAVGCSGKTVTIVDMDAGGAGGSGGGSGGAVDAGGGGGSEDAGNPVDANVPVDANAPTCPANAPMIGKPCTQSGLTCDYDHNCTIAYCSDASWTIEYTCQDGKDSGSNDSGSNAGCPSSYQSIAQGQACSPANVVCQYPQGECDCTIPTGGPARQNPTNEWICEDPAPGCPTPRPLTGSMCTTPGQFCDYGACSLPDGIALTCKNSAWVTTQVPCPA
jgi:hypothetical protein